MTNNEVSRRKVLQGVGAMLSGSAAAGTAVADKGSRNYEEKGNVSGFNDIECTEEEVALGRGETWEGEVNGTEVAVTNKAVTPDGADIYVEGETTYFQETDGESFNIGDTEAYDVEVTRTNTNRSEGYVQFKFMHCEQN